MFDLHINCVNSSTGHVLWNLPGSRSLLCGFPTCLRASGLPVVWPQLGKGGVQMLATGFPRTHRAPSVLHPASRALLASLVWGAREASPEALWEAPGWLRAGSNRAQGLLPLCLPKRGPPLRATQRESLGPSPAHRGLARAAPPPPPLRPQRRPGAQRQWAGEGLSPPTGAK